jgi:hypothetical protein
LACHKVHVADQAGIFLTQFCVGSDYLAGDDQNMDRRLRLNIVESKTEIVLESNASRYRAIENFQKHVVSKHSTTPVDDFFLSGSMGEVTELEQICVGG